VQKRLVRGDIFYLKFWINSIADFQSLFASRESAITPSEKSSINTNRKFTTRFPMSVISTSYVVPKNDKGWLKEAKSVQNLNNKLR